MRDGKEVSIVIPYWRGARYLEDCITSIDRQGVSCEILLVCDRGHDEIPRTVQDNPNVKILKAEAVPGFPAGKGTSGQEDSPLGPAFCRNAALDNASCEYVYFIDSDDYLLEDTLSPMLNLAEERAAGAVTGNQYSSWFSSYNFDPEQAGRETGIKENGLLQGELLRQRFKNRLTVQHFLVRRSLLEENRIRFDAGRFRYSDMEFIFRVLQCAAGHVWAVRDSFYVCRNHNDRIHLPSLSQTEDRNCGDDYLDACRASEEWIREGDQELQKVLDHCLIQFVLSHYPGLLSQTAMSSLRPRFRRMADWKGRQEGLPFWQKKMLDAMRSGYNRIARLCHKCYVVGKKKQGLLGNRIQWYRVLEHLLFRRLPLRRDWIILESFFGRSYSDSPRYLYEYLQRTYGSRYRYIWVLNGRSEELDKSGKHTVCRLESLRYVYYMSRCGYRIFNVRQPSWNKKRAGVVFLETWHGTPLKKLGFDMEDVFSADPEFKTVFYTQAKEWDYLVSANSFSTEVFERAFGYDRERILEYGYPRNDILYSEDKDTIAAGVKRELGIPEGKRVLLYAPTWRDDQAIVTGQYGFELALDLGRLREEFGKDTVVLLRTHYYVAQQINLEAYQGFVYNGSSYEDVSRLYLASDVLITDYSSVFFDYANLRRPILFFAYDYKSYADELRGLYIDMEKELPGPVLATNDELVEALRHLEEISERYRSRYEKFYERFCSVDNGTASERIIEKVFRKR